MLKKIMIVCLFLSVVLLSKPMITDADETVGFSYENIIPQNQVKETTGNYFDLKVTPGETQEIQTKVTNETKKNKKIKISINNATTTSSGEINYSSSKIKLSDKAEYTLSDVMDGPSQIDLKPEETKMVTFKLSIPKKKFDGYILGGVHLKEIMQEEDKSVQTSSGIKNEFAYVYSVRLREENKKIKPNFKGLSSNYESNYISVSFQNEVPLMIKELMVEMVIMSEKSDEILAEKKVKDYQMAPYSSIVIPFDKPFEGNKGETYRTITKVSLDGQKWEFESKVKLGEGVPKVKNRMNTSRAKKTNWLFFIILGSIFLLSVGIMYLILMKIKKGK